MQEINNVNKKYHLIDYNKWLSSKTNPFTQRQEVCTNVDVVCRYQLDMKGQIYLLFVKLIVIHLLKYGFNF